MNERLKKKAQKLIDNNGNEYLAQLDATIEISDKLDDLTEAIKDFQTPEPPEVEVNLDKTDTLLQDILAELKKKDEEEITYSISPEDQEKLRGEDGYTPEKGVDYFDGKDGQNGENGKDGSPDTREDIIKKINEGGVLKINASEVTGLPDFTREVVREVGMGFVETPIKAGSNISITTDASGARVISSTASGGGSFATLTGDPYDNANLTTALDAKQDDITLTTTGSSGASTLVGATLNIPTYTLAGLGGANTALSNLSSVAINTSLISDTTKTDDLGSSTIKWRNTYTENLYADTIGITSLKGVFGERFLFVNEFSDVLWRADKRFTVTSSWGGGILANLFKGGFENTYTITPSVTDVININLANQSGVPAGGVTYPEGKFYVHFYYTNNNYSAISARVKEGGVWYALATPVNISTVVGDKVLEFSIPGANYLTDIELTITTNGSDNVLVTALNYVCNRWTAELELPYFDKFALSNSIMGNTAFRTVSQTTSANINADGDWYMGVGGTGGKFGIGTSSPGTYHLNVVGNILGNSIYTNSGQIFGSLGIAYLRAGSTNPTHINDTASGDIWLAGGGGDVGVGEQYPTNRLHVKALSATASYNLLNIDGGATGFSGANDTGAYSIIFSGCAYQTSIVQVIGAKIQFEKANTWNYADTPTGTRSIVNFYASAGTPDSPTLVKFLSGYWDNTVRLPSLDTDATAPTTSGTTKMVITDANGQLSFTTIPTSGSATFIGLTDVPANFTGSANKYVRVNAGETALEFVTLAGGGDALVANPLSQFASTTSLQLAGVISDETGSGALVFATSPTLVTPILGTPTSGTLTNCTGLPLTGLVSDTTTALGIGSINLGHASDTTIARVSAGVISVEGVTIPTISSTSTLTNKRITKRVVTTTDDATAVIDVDATDVYELSAVANATTFSTTGTPTDGQTMLIRFKDAGVAKGLTWDAIFVAIGVTLPTTTVVSKWHYVGVQYNSSATKWHTIAVSVEA
jgi:hypothetical protein